MLDRVLNTFFLWTNRIQKKNIDMKLGPYAAQEMNFSLNDFFSKCDQIFKKLHFWCSNRDATLFRQDFRDLCWSRVELEWLASNCDLFQKKFIKLFFADIRSVLPCYHLFKSVLKTVWFARFSHCNKMTALYNFENIQESYATVRLIGNELLWLTSKSKLFDVRWHASQV